MGSEKPLGFGRCAVASYPESSQVIDMADIPEDIFTEPSDVDAKTLDNLGPLRRLAGIWQGDRGVDINPKEDGPEQRVYRERIEMHPIDPQANGPQLFYGLRYHVHINTPDEAITFHDQVGYWLWEPATGLVLQTVAIPRGQVAIAAGHAAPDATTLKLKATRGETEYGICSTTFLEQAFRTDSYEIDVTFNPDGSWTYVSDTTLTVRASGYTEPFVHRDTNTLFKVAEPKPNPLAVFEAAG
ncbi:MAG: heme-binding beta-barrel domain-containing protein [Novosphingobium sp.]